MEKPSPEAKALSLFLMAFKKTNPQIKEKAKQINKSFDLVKANELSREAYTKEIENTLATYGGYSEVIEKTVKFYIETTGEWKLEGEDKYCKDAKKIADEILKKK